MATPSVFTPRLIALCSIALFTPCVSASAESDHFTISQVMSAPFASGLLASPTGAAAVWLLNEQGRRNIWFASAPAWKARKLTHFDADDGQEIDELSWAPDGAYLLFARGGDFERHGENPNPALNAEQPEQSIWKVTLDGSLEKKLAVGRAPAVSPDGKWVAFLRAGQISLMKPSGEDARTAVSDKRVTFATWSPDGSRLAFISERTDHSLIGIYSLPNRGLDYLDASVDSDSNPVWSSDGKRIAYTRIPATTRAFAFGPQRAAEPWSIRVADLETKISHQIFRSKEGPGSVFHPVTADQQLFWTSSGALVFPWERTGWCHLYRVVSPDEAPVELTPGEGEVEHVAVSRDRKTLFYSANFSDIDRRHIWSLDAAGAAPPKQISRGEGIELEPMPTADGTATVYLASSYNTKVHAMARTGDGHSRELAPEATPVAFPAQLLVKPQPVMLTAADGLPIHAQLFLPTQRSEQLHPALVFFHGGSRRQMLLGFHYMYYYSNAYSLEQYFANCGYIVLSVNYRSGIGYGLNFREALNYGATGASEFNDVLGAGLYLKSRPDVDAARIGVWGGSYGGYLTALALARASDLFRAGVDFHGVHDWNLEIKTFAPAYNPRVQTEAARVAFESSPLASVDTWRSPVLLIHGDDDRNVPFSETVHLVEALRQRHVEFETLIFPNEIHDFLLYRHWVEAYTAAADFFQRKLEVAYTKEPLTRVH